MNMVNPFRSLPSSNKSKKYDNPVWSIWEHPSLTYMSLNLYIFLPWFHIESVTPKKSTQPVSDLEPHFLTEMNLFRSLQWRHNDNDGVSNHQPHGCLLNRLFRRISKKTSKLHVTGLCVGNSPGPVNFLQKGPVTRKMFPFDDVIMLNQHRN